MGSLELDSENIYLKSEANEVLHKLKKFAMKNSVVQMLTFLTKAEEELSDMFFENGDR
jgi:predicted transcriptional regulator